ncbi:MAG TPA: phosphoenolpyruvate--protein phosphotransferase [bacterium]
MEILKGIPVSKGIGIGKAIILDSNATPVSHYHIKPSGIKKEKQKFVKALDTTKNEIKKIKKEIDKKIGKDVIFILDAHIMILEDKALIKKTLEIIRDEKINAEWAIERILAEIENTFAKIEDEYIKERSRDVEHVFKRVLKNLGIKQPEKEKIDNTGIIIARDISPADTALFTNERVFGIATEMGTRTSHVAILARALEIPAVVGIEKICNKAKADDNVIINGIDGEVIINPSPQIYQKYIKLQKKIIRKEKGFKKLKTLLPVTIDGTYIKLMANVEFLSEIPAVIANSAEGIGLFRTEFLYLNRTEMPAEEEHFSVYKQVAEKMGALTTIIRTVDIGSDKLAKFLNFEKEVNPALGLRAIRLCLHNIDLFRVQLRAILRASAYGNLKILIPMIADINEIRKAKEIILDIKREIKTSGIKFNENIPVGIMIETPSASIISDILAKEVDFFSIGTNDLIQYTLAIDRTNEHVAYLYNPLHPAILRLIKNIIQSALQAGIEVNICGEMAGDVFYIPILIGLGLRHLSMDPKTVPLVKKIINSIDITTAEEIANAALSMKNSSEIITLLREKFGDYLPYG